MGWLIFLGIVVAYTVGWNFFYKVAYKNYYVLWEKDWKRKAAAYPYLYGRKVTLKDYESDAGDARMISGMLATFWPLSMFYFAFKNVVNLDVEPNTSNYNRLKQEKEIKELKALAKEHGLKLPENL